MALASRRTVAWAPTAVYLLGYFLTTVVAATGYMLPAGPARIVATGTHIGPEVVAVIGSPVYLALLYLPLVIVPAVAFFVIKFAAKLPVSFSIGASRISSVGISALLAVSVVYCLYRLHQLGALNLDLFSGRGHDTMTQTRMSLLDNLGYPFFAFAYGVNVILPVLSFLAYVLQGRRWQDLVLFIASFVVLLVLVALTYSKSQILVFGVLFVCGGILARANVRVMAAVSALCVIAFFAVGFLVSAFEAAPTTTATTELPRPASTQNIGKADVGGYILKASLAAADRMAIGLPFYVEIFNNPAERCGIQGQELRQVLRLPASKCILPPKVFAAIYPWIDWTIGQQPAPAHVSAYGEIGFGWALVVMVLVGLSLGIVGGIAASADIGPLSIGLAVAAAALGYYFGQVPFIASFTYPHGFIPFVAPVVFLSIIAHVGGNHRLIARWRRVSPLPAEGPVFNNGQKGIKDPL